jgi:hypothetical protein
LEIKTEIGAALGVPPNASRVLDHLGVAKENLKGVPFLGVHFNILFDFCHYSKSALGCRLRL